MKYQIVKKIKIITIVVFILTFGIIVESLKADIILLGYIHNSEGFVSDAPLGRNDIWKAFRFQATVNGRMDYFQMFFGGFVDAVETDNEVAWAIYEDNDMHVGTLKVSGYVSNYDWTIIGPGENHTFPLTTVHQNRDIIAGNYYWVTFHASGGNNIQISRGRVSGCNSGSLRWATNQFSWTIFNPPPPPSEFINSYNQGCYGWAVWQSDSNNTAPTILNSIEDIYEDEDFGSLLVANLDTVFYDEDLSDGDSLRFLSIPSIGLVNTEISGNELTISSNPNLTGIETVVVIATDNSYASVFDTFSVTINPIPDQPTSFNLISPINDFHFSSIDTIDFLWHSSHDVDSDPIYYDFNLYGAGTESTLTNISDTTLQFISEEFFEENSQYNWHIYANDGMYSVPSLETFIFFTPPLGRINDYPVKLPNSYKLYQNYPNPFNPSTIIKYDLPVKADVVIEIYNVLGQMVFSFTEKNMSPGNHKIEFNADILTSGIYMYIIHAGDFQETKKMVLIH